MRRLAVLVISALALLLVGTALPAQAESWTGSDPVDDVQRLTKAGDGDEYTAAPTRANPDILGARVRHGRRAVVVSVWFDDIFVPPGTTGVFAVFGETRSDVPGASWDMWATQARRQGRVTIWRRGEKCLGSSRVDYARDRARVVLPRTCLGDPAWVSATFQAWSQDRTYVWEDKAFQPGYLRDRWTPRLRVG